jgi:hypothetical protein
MKTEHHLEAFEEHKKTIFKWALDIYGISKSQRIVGLHASRGIIELLSAYLHKKKLVDKGFQLNHRWFKSDRVSKRLPGFDNKDKIIRKMIELEQLSEKLSYGSPKQGGMTEKTLALFNDLEDEITGMMKNG